MLRAPASIASLAVLCALASACKGPAARRPDLPLPADIAELPLFDPAAVGTGRAPPGLAAAPLAVVDTSPLGRQDAVHQLRVRFNQPVVALDLADDKNLPSFTLDPPLPGRARWLAPDLLVFEPSAAARPATRYSVRVTGIRGFEGQTLATTPTWTFETPRPQVSEVTPGEDTLDHPLRAPLFLAFDQPITAAALAAHLEARARPLTAAKDSKPTPIGLRVNPTTHADLAVAGYPYKERQLGNLYTVLATSKWPAASAITLELRPGLQGSAGPLAIDAPWSTTFSTPQPQSLESSNCTREAPCGFESPELKFRNPVGEKQEDLFTITPRVEHFDVGIYERDVSLSGAFLPDTTYTVHVAAGLEDSFGQTLPAFKRKLVFTSRAGLALSSTTGILSPDRPHLGLETHHLKSVRIKIAVLGDAELAAIPDLAPYDEQRLAAIPFPANAHTHTFAVTPRGVTRWGSEILDLAALTAPLRPAGTSLHGAVLVEVSAHEALGVAVGRPPPPPVRGLLRVSDLMLVAHASRAGTVVRATHVSSGAPADNVAVCRLGPTVADPTCHPLGTTDSEGLVRADVPFPRNIRPRWYDPADDSEPPDPDAPPLERLRLVAHDPLTRDGASLELGLAPDTDRWYRWHRGHHPRIDNPNLRPGERLRVRLVRERGAYRPGERVHLVGWTAIDTPHTRHNLAPLTRGTPVQFSLRDPSGAVVVNTTGRTTQAGKFTATLALPADARLGGYTASATLLGDTTRTSLRVEDYRVPEFSVTAAARSPDVVHGERAVVDVRADYYFGGPVALTRVWRGIDCAQISFRPPNLEPTWVVGIDTTGPRTKSTPRAQIPTTRADAPGQRKIHEVLDVSEPAVPHRCTVSVFAEDASAQGVGAETTLTVHPAAVYLAAHPPAGVHVGDRASIPLRALTRDGDRVAATRVRVELERRWDEPVYSNEDGHQRQVDVRHHKAALAPCTVDLAAAGPDAACTLPADAPGTYHFTALADVDGRKPRTTGSFSVTPRPDPSPIAKYDPPSTLELHPSHTTARPGDRIDVVIRGPWNGARGELVSARGGVHDVHPFVLVDKQATITLIADDTWTPTLHLMAHVVAPDRGRHYSRLPSRRSASAEIHQDADHRRLRVAVTAPRQAGPGDNIPVTIAVRDSQDRPVAGRVSVWAVDEAVLALTDEQLPDLLPDFIPERTAEVDDLDDFYALLLPYVVVKDDPWLVGGGGGSGMGGRQTRTPSVMQGSASASPGPGTARSKFETTPLFLADVAVDATGSARVTATLPDNLTTFRITALASATLAGSDNPGRFGGAEARTVVTAPLVVRAATPRGLRPGDTAELAALVENRTGVAGRVDVTASLVDATGPNGHALEFLSKQSGHTTVEPGGQARVAFRVRARAALDVELDLAARFTAGDTRASDAVRVQIPIAAEPTLTERIAVTGELTSDRAVKIPVQLPRAVLPGHGGLELRTSSSLLAGLDDAARALVDYPYGCLEQTASRLLPLIALQTLELETPPEFLTATLARLKTMQTHGGGFGYWPGDPDVNPYASAYAVWVLQRAAAAGLAVPEDMLTRGLDDLAARVADTDLASLSATLRTDAGIPQALALLALADAGRDIQAPAAVLFAQRGGLPLFARAALLLALHRHSPASPDTRALADELLGSLSEGASEAHTVERLSHSMDVYFHSEARSDALVLLALLASKPDHPILAKLVRGLQDRRHGGAWRNTQENAHAILALADYARVHEPVVPDLQARAWLARRTILDTHLRGRDAASAVTTPMVDLLALTQKTDGLLPVVLHREGQGKLYYRLGVAWAPAGDDLPARDQGLALTRTLRSATGPLTTAASLGDPISVDLVLTNPRRVRYVAVDIPIPAGLEPVQTDLGQGHSAATLGGASGGWFDRQELHHDRVLLFADDLPPGTHVHTVHLRATSRGRYAFPPAHTEAMYIPEIYGRSAGATLEVR